MREVKSPADAPPPPGFIDFQKKVWFQLCAPLLRMAAFDTSLAVSLMMDSRDLAARGVFCFEDEDTAHVARSIAHQEIRRVPVVSRDRRLVGVLSLGDLAPHGANPASRQSGP